MSNEFIVKNGLIVGGNVVTSGTITINGALAATQSWVTSQAYLTSASLSGYATQSYVTSAISSLIDAAPAALDTLNELAAALGDDASFSTTITNSIANKVAKSGDTMTGSLLFANVADNVRLQKGSSFLNLRDPWNNIHLYNAGDGNYIDSNIHYWRSQSASYWMTLNNGNLGIGTVSPVSRLDVDGIISSRGIFIAQNSGTYNVIYNASNSVSMYLGGSGDPANYYDNTTHNFRSSGGGTTYAVITNGGNVGIGTTAPNYKLDVNGGINIYSGNGLRWGSGDAEIINSGYNLLFKTYTGSALTEKMRITPGGSLLLGDVAVPGESAWYGTAVFGKSGTDKVISGYLSSSTNGAVIGGHNSGLGAWAPFNVVGSELRFSIQENRAVTIDAARNVGVGTSTPSEKFHVSGAAIFDGGSGNSSTDAVVYITKSNNNDWGLYVNASGLDYGMYTRVSPSASYAFAIHNGTTWTTRIAGNGVIYLNEKDTINPTDSWLRLNNSGSFTSGVYTPGILRNDGEFINYGGIYGYNTIRGRKSQTNNLYTSAALWTESYDNTTTGIAFHISGNVGKFLEMRTNGILYWDNYTVITSANIGSQSVSYANNAGYAAESGQVINQTGQLLRYDNRTISPSETTAGYLQFGFTSWANDNSGPYADYLHLRSYTDGSGGNDNLVMFLKSGIGMRIYQQTFGSGSAYSSYADVWHTGNLTNLNQLSNGPGYITSYSETDTLASVTGRGASTSTAISLNGGASIAGITNNGNLVNNGKIIVQNYTNGTNARGIFMWAAADSNWGIYMATSTVGASLADGNSVASIDGRTSHHIRFRVYSSSGNGFIWENNAEQSLMSLTADSGNLYTRGQIYAGNSTSNLVWHAGNDGSGSGLDADTVDGIDSGSFLRSDVSDSFSGTLTMATQRAFIPSNYGHGVYGLYSAERYQHVWSMGAGYDLPADGVSNGNGGSLYGLAWSYNPDYSYVGSNAQSKPGLNHQLLLMMNGITHTAIGSGIWTNGTITTVSHGTSAQWNTAYGWGNHASQGYATTSYVTTQINNLINGAPGALDTLSELASALGNDSSFATTVTNSIASKLSLSGGTMTGQILFQTSALNNGFRWDVNSDAAGITFKNTGDGDNNSYFNFFTEDNGNEYFKFSHNTWNIGSFDFMDVKNGVVRTNGNIYVNASQSGSRSAGTNELINGNRVWHDGDFSSSNISNWNTAYGWGNHASAGYAAASSLANYLPLGGGTMTGNLTLKYDTSNSDGYNGLTFAPGSDDYIIKAPTTYGVFGRQSFGWHVNSTSAFGVYSSGWVKLFGVEGGTGNTQVFGNLTVNGVITESSSLKLKENVETSEGNLEKVVNLRPVTYNKIGSQTKELGLIAEEVAEVYPEFVQYDENGEPVGVHYSRLTAALIGAVKELTNQVQELNKKING